MKHTLSLAILLVLMVLLSYTDDVSAELKLYDDFSSGYIDGDKWRKRGYVREIVNGELILKMGNRSPGMELEFVPGLFINHIDVNPNFINPHTINSIQCDITIVESKLDSAPNSESYARIAGIFYSTDSTGGGTTGGGKGDVWVELGIGDRGNGGLEVFGLVYEFLEDNYQSFLLIDSVTILGPINNVTYPITYTLKLIYDGNNSFEFWANNISDSLTGPAYQDLPYEKPIKLETVIKTTDGSNNGYISAKFDDVYINNQLTVYDDFSTDLIDPEKWNDIDLVREASNGYLRANIIGYGSYRYIGTGLSYRNAPYLEAKARIDSSSQMATGAYGVGRIQGYYYNDSRGPGSGQPYNLHEGDVFAQVRVRHNGDGTNRAEAFVHRSDNAEESSFTELFSHIFTIPINLDTYYRVSIWFVGNQLIFGCDGETITYDISTPIYQAYEVHRSLRSYVTNLGPGETGYIKASFDDVVVETFLSDLNPLDGDVDGSDLASYIVDDDGISLSEFANEFGKIN